MLSYKTNLVRRRAEWAGRLGYPGCGAGLSRTSSLKQGDSDHGPNGNPRAPTNDNDVIKGEGGDDIITSILGLSTISGGDGDDTIYCDDGFSESIFGDAGTDSVRADADDILFSIETTLPA